MQQHKAAACQGNVFSLLALVPDPDPPAAAAALTADGHWLLCALHLPALLCHVRALHLVRQHLPPAADGAGACYWPPYVRVPGVGWRPGSAAPGVA